MLMFYSLFNEILRVLKYDVMSICNYLLPSGGTLCLHLGVLSAQFKSILKILEMVKNKFLLQQNSTVKRCW